MKPEAANYLEKARENLDEARAIYGIGLASVAARSAYYAAFHAAQALIISQTGKVAKTHSGVRAEYSRLAKGNEHIRAEFGAFLAKAYAFKEIDDYSVEKKSLITMDMAKTAIDLAEEFVDCIAGVLTGH